MAHTFALGNLVYIPVYGLDPENPEGDQIEVTNYWFISYTLETPQGTYVSNYTAEASQLPAEPTETDIEELILSLYGL